MEQNNRQITQEPYLLNEKELYKYPIVRENRRERPGTLKSECRKTKVHMYYYETCIYNIDGKEVNCSECQIKDKQKQKIKFRTKNKLIIIGII